MISMNEFPECEQFGGFRKQNCRHERLTPEQCDKWRAAQGLSPVVEFVAMSGSFGFSKDDVEKTPQVLPPRTDQPRKKPTPQVGDILGGLFAKLGVANCIPGGGCQSTKGKMNAAGIQGCKQRREEFIAEIKERVKDISLAVWVRAAAKAIATGLVFHLNPFNPVPSLYDYAIQLAEEQAQ